MLIQSNIRMIVVTKYLKFDYSYKLNSFCLILKSILKLFFVKNNKITEETMSS